jgi:N6-L-threonylcarbamoyladenine synthase
MKYFLGIETSCDETAAAVFNEDHQILSNIVASQACFHEPFTGVVPEIAARAHLRQLLPTIDAALKGAGCTAVDLTAVAVHHTPGLVGSLLVGVTAAKMLAAVLDIPLLAVNHIHSHIFACQLAADRDIFPCVGLVVSGGHTVLLRCESATAMTVLGGTRDDAAGEAFDKVAAILGLGFPGGPAVEQEAAQGNPTAYHFPRAFIDDGRLEFSFSGLKTAVLYACFGQNNRRGEPPPPGSLRADLAASFQAAVIDVLVFKAKQALRQTGLRRLAVGGGVAANKALRQALQDMCQRQKAELVIPPPQLCTDNAAMAAWAVELWRRQQWASLDLDAQPNWLCH